MQNILFSPEYLFAFTYILKPLLVLVFGVVGAYLLNKLVLKRLRSRYPDDLSAHVLARIFSYLLYFLVAAVVLQSFGINMTALIGAAGVLGVAVGFAAQTSVANIISGLFLTLERPFNINDLVEINGIEGVIQALNLFAITLRTSDNKLVRIPNETVLKSNILNISKNNMRRFETVIDFVPETDMSQAFELLRRVIKDSDYALHQEPLLVITNISGNYVRVLIGVWTTQKNWHITRQRFLSDVKLSFDEYGIKLASVLHCPRE